MKDITQSLPQALLGIVLLFSFVALYIDGEEMGSSRLAAFILLALPAAFPILFRKMDFKLFLKGFKYACGFALAFLVCILVNLSQYPDAGEIAYNAGLVGSLFFVMIIASILVSSNPDFFGKSLSIYAVSGTLFLLYIIATETTPGVARQIPAGIHPNLWGLHAFSIIASALFIPKRWLRWSIWLVCLYMQYLVSSRGALLGGLAIIFMQSFTFLRQRKQVSLTGLILAIFLIVLILSVFLMPQVPFLQSLHNFIFYDVLQMDAPNRGLGSGGTGRMEWNIMALKLWAENPVFGIGYGNSISVHNGFLLLLAETGIVGLSIFLYLVMRAMLNGKSMFSDRYLMGIIGYLAILLTYNRGFNVYAPGIIFLFSLWQSLVRPAPPPGEKPG